MNELCFVISSLSIMALQKDTLPNYVLQFVSSRVPSSVSGLTSGLNSSSTL